MSQDLPGTDTGAVSFAHLSRAHAAMQRLANSAQMIVWMTDVRGICIYLNKNARAVIDSLDELSRFDWLKFVHPEDVTSVCARFVQANEAQDEYQLEYRVLKSDGTVRWVLESGAPRYTDEGKFDGYTGSTIDVTNQHNAFNRLARSETEHRLLAENSSDLISHCGPDGTYLYVSPSYTKALGQEVNSLVGQNAYDVIHPDDRRMVRDEVFKQSQTGAKSQVIEIRKRHRLGHYIWVGANIQVIHDAVTGAKTGTVAVSREITLERQSRDELERSEQRFRSLAELSSDWYWETDALHRFTFFSEGMQRILGVFPEHLLGKRRDELAADPNQLEMLDYLRKIDGRQSFKNLSLSFNGPVTGKNYHSEISGEPIIEDGVFQGYRGTGRDITAKKEIQKQLSQFADENNALFENSPDIIMLFDDVGRLLRANAVVRNIIGFEPQELIGRHHLQFVTPDTRHKTSAMVSLMQNGQASVPEFDNCWFRKDGSVVHLSWALRRSADNTRTYATARDVTETYQARTELLRIHARHKAILESIGDAFFSLDKDWRVTYANLKTAEFVGVDRDAAIGKLLWEVVPDILTSAVFPYYQHAMLTGENAFFEEYYEPVGAWVDVRVYPHDEGLSIFFHDVSERREAERAIRESEQRFREMIEITPAGYVATDAHGIVLDVNPALCKLSGYQREEFVGQDILSFLPACPVDGALSVKGGISSAHGKETHIRHKQGHMLHVLTSLSIKRDAEGDGLSLTAFVTDITERKHVEARLEQLATHDTLTGLPNRELINQRLQSMLDRAQELDSIAVMFIDLDRFKEVNDSMGHAPGDELLQQVAHRLQNYMRPNDIVARLGGDEFVVAAHCSDGRTSAAAIAEKLLAGLMAPFEIRGQEVFISASIGISMFAEDAGRKELLFQNADMAMYRAKALGRNNYQFFEAEMSTEAKMRMALEHALPRALERGEFELHYQPRVNLRTMRVVGMEALIRWNHPQLGRIPPMQFIPIAEDRGLIESIGQWVLGEACSQTVRLAKELGRPLNISVNLSARQLKCPNLVAQVEEALAKSGLAPALLELELTESALVDDMDMSVDVLKRLKMLGILLSVDDFGTGYSGLSYLKRFPVDILKLDRSFVLQQSEGVSSFDFIKAFVDMAHALKLSVVAEGIETREVLQLLVDSDCDEGQGYFFCKPAAIDELRNYFARMPLMG